MLSFRSLRGGRINSCLGEGFGGSESCLIKGIGSNLGAYTCSDFTCRSFASLRVLLFLKMCPSSVISVISRAKSTAYSGRRSCLLQYPDKLFLTSTQRCMSSSGREDSFFPVTNLSSAAAMIFGRKPARICRNSPTTALCVMKVLMRRSAFRRLE
jgi:hypothetical protein